MDSQCIIIIDPQLDFTSEEGAYAQRHPGITAIINAKNAIQQLLDTKSGHSYIAVYADYTANQFGDGLNMCIPGTTGHSLGITISPEIKQISKPQHSAFSNPAFLAHLHQENVQHLYLCGFLAEYCVKQTALDALHNGFRVSLISDCIATGDDVIDRVREMIEELEKSGVGVIQSSSL
jgi:nicotinamidase-related amidase